MYPCQHLVTPLTSTVHSYTGAYLAPVWEHWTPCIETPTQIYHGTAARAGRLDYSGSDPSLYRR